MQKTFFGLGCAALVLILACEDTSASTDSVPTVEANAAAPAAVDQPVDDGKASAPLAVAPTVAEVASPQQDPAVHPSEAATAEANAAVATEGEADDRSQAQTQAQTQVQTQAQTQAQTDVRAEAHSERRAEARNTGAAPKANDSLAATAPQRQEDQPTHNTNVNVESCGEKGQPLCPLQGWMEKNLESAMDTEDFGKLTANLRKAATLTPDASWNTDDPAWNTIAKEGADAAANKDMAGVRASCKACHRAFRKRYKTEFRTKPLA